MSKIIKSSLFIQFFSKTYYYQKPNYGKLNVSIVDDFCGHLVL